MQGHSVKMITGVEKNEDGKEYTDLRTIVKETTFVLAYWYQRNAEKRLLTGEGNFKEGFANKVEINEALKAGEC